MNARFGAELPDPCRKSLDGSLHLRNVPQLEAESRIEWSRRLTQSLGRCYPDKRLIRIASHLESASDRLLQEVLCHEMTHLAARSRAVALRGRGRLDPEDHARAVLPSGV